MGLLPSATGSDFVALASTAGSDDSIFPQIPDVSQGGWIADGFADIINSVKTGQSPYLVIVDIIRRLYYPTLGEGFRAQVWVLIALFAFTMATILFGLILRWRHGKMWWFHRLDCTVVIPGGSLFSICALCYAALGILVLAGAYEISHFHDPYPRWFTGLHAAWIAPLWTGIFFEIWACLAAWQVSGVLHKGDDDERRSCPQVHPSFRTALSRTTTKTIVALAIPVIILAGVWVPTTWLYVSGSRAFNDSVGWSVQIREMCLDWNEAWTPDKGLEISKLYNLFEPGGQLGLDLLRYSQRFTDGGLYVTIFLLVTLVVYLVGAVLEFSHLSRTIRRLKAESNDVALERTTPESSEPPKSPTARSSISLADSPVPLVFNATSQARLDDDDEYHSPRVTNRGDRGGRPWELMEWAKSNRIMTTACISAMSLVNAGICLWKALTPLTVQTPSA
ncbi:hypothetical protein JCM10212_000661, partial [Sporobolomyces blumeae]